MTQYRKTIILIICGFLAIVVIRDARAQAPVIQAPEAPRSPMRVQGLIGDFPAWEHPVHRSQRVVLNDRHRTIGVSIVPRTTPLKVGTPISFRLTSNQTGFVHLYVLWPSGKAQILFENVPVNARASFRYPSPGIDIRVSPPAGEATLVFVATLTRIDGFHGRGTTRSPFRLHVNASEFRDQIATRTSGLPREAWGSTGLVVRVLDK